MFHQFGHLGRLSLRDHFGPLGEAWSTRWHEQKKMGSQSPFLGPLWGFQASGSCPRDPGVSLGCSGSAVWKGCAVRWTTAYSNERRSTSTLSGGIRWDHQWPMLDCEHCLVVWAWEKLLEACRAFARPSVVANHSCTVWCDTHKCSCYPPL